MTLIGAITRIMRSEGIIRGDTDAPTTLSDLQHGATINMAAIAVQDELNELVSDELIPYEHSTTGSIVSVVGQSSYALASDFIRFFGVASLYDSTNKIRIYEYPGGEEALQQSFFEYKTTQGNPQAWYFDATTTKKIGLWPVPSSVKTWTYDYEKDVSVTSASDTLPFHNESEAQAFCRLAARRFKFIYEGMDKAAIPTDPERLVAKAALISLMIGKNAPKMYAPVYR